MEAGEKGVGLYVPRAARWRISSADSIEADWGPDATDAEFQARALVSNLNLGSWPE